jgi:alpha-mannosidase
MKDYERVQFRWDSNSEAMVWTEAGEAVQGLTGGGERTEWIFPQEWKTDGQKHTFYVEMACNGMFGNPPSDIIQPPNPNRTLVVLPKMLKRFSDAFQFSFEARQHLCSEFGGLGVIH